jgi:hypothetical protein
MTIRGTASLALLGLMTAALVAAPPAAAKGPITGMQACGPDRCVTVPLAGAEGHRGADFLVQGGPARGPAPGPYYELRLLGGGGTPAFTLFVLPAAGLVHQSTTEGTWFPMPSGIAERIRTATADSAPYRFRLAAVIANTHRVEDTRPYRSLLGLLPGRRTIPDAYDHRSGWLAVDLTAVGMTPWTGAGVVHVLYDPRLRAVSLDGLTWTRVTTGMGERVEADAGGPFTRPDTNGGGLPWVPMAAAIAVLALLAAAAVAVSERRRQVSH